MQQTREQTQVLKPKELKINDIKFQDVTQLDGGKVKMVFIKMKDDNSVNIQIPEAECAFDCQFYPDGDDDNGQLKFRRASGGWT